MAADLEQVKTLSKEIEALIKRIDDAKSEGLLDAIHCMEMRQLGDGVKGKLKEAMDDDRTLKIGVIGDVKAGKSSFVNTCIFDGKSVLPTSVTPTTATLTKITYSEVPCTTIHFCTKEDWTRIEDGANSYDLSLQTAYDKYVNETLEKKQRLSKDNIKYHAAKTVASTIDGVTSIVDREKNKTSNGAKLSQIVDKFAVMSKEAFERSQSWMEMRSEIEKACREIVDMVHNCKKVDLLSLLGSTTTISTEELNDYVGATGTYTPVVNYVEMQTDNEMLEGLMLVDTPGLEDPVESRGRKTKEFLETCDVVIFLSRCSQFMGDSTVRMIDQLPSAGVKRIIVAGSKFDLGILDNNRKTFDEAVGSTKSSNLKQFRTNIAELLAQHSDDEIRFRTLKKIETADPIFTSSILYTAAKKLKANIDLNAEEIHIINQLSRFAGFTSDVKTLRGLSGIQEIHKKLNEVMDEKERIISESGDELVQNVSIRLRNKLNEIITDSKRRMNDVKNGEASTYKQRYEHLVSIIDSTRNKLKHIFEIAADDCQKTQIVIESYIKMDMRNNTKLKVDTKTETDSYTTGYLWWREDHTDTTTINIVSVAAVINNINAYFASCQRIVSEQFKTLVNKEDISAKVKEVVLGAYNEGKFDFSEDDILIPLESTLSKIEIPPYVIDPHRFIDRVRSKFSAGYVEDEKIHELNAMQSQMLSEASDEMIKALRECTERIRKTLLIQAACFSDDIEKRISGESESVLKQMNDKESFIGKYEELIEELTTAKSKTDKAVG